MVTSYLCCIHLQVIFAGKYIPPTLQYLGSSITPTFNFKSGSSRKFIHGSVLQLMTRLHRARYSPRRSPHISAAREESWAIRFVVIHPGSGFTLAVTVTGRHPRYHVRLACHNTFVSECSNIHDRHNVYCNTWEKVTIM